MREKRRDCGHTCLGIVDAGNVVHTAGHDKDAVGRPGEIIDLGTGRSTHMLDTPGLQVVRPVFSEGWLVVELGRHPEQNVPIVSGRSQHFP
jgi:hypothetical protein